MTDETRIDPREIDRMVDGEMSSDEQRGLLLQSAVMIPIISKYMRDAYYVQYNK